MFTRIMARENGRNISPSKIRNEDTVKIRDDVKQMKDSHTYGTFLEISNIIAHRDAITAHINKGEAEIAMLEKGAGGICPSSKPIYPQVRLVLPSFPDCDPTIAFTVLPYSQTDGGDDKLVDLCDLPRPRVKFVGIGNNAVKTAFKVAGFKRTKNNNWQALWSGGSLKTEYFKQLNAYQKVNHFPGTWEVGRKDKLYSHIAYMKRRHPEDFNFLPRFFVLPKDSRDWFIDFERQPQVCYIVKPKNSSRGRGVHLLRKPAELQQGKECIVQHYIINAALIEGYKYDLRLYVVVTSFDPLRVYLYKEGLVRFATEKFTLDHKGLRQKFAHVTNYSVNRKNSKFQQNQHSYQDGHGSKWSLSALQKYLASQGVPFGPIWNQICDIVLKTMIAVEPQISTLCQLYVPNRCCCYELYGFDIVLDSSFKAWLLEVNTGPALQCPTALDRHIKYRMVADMLHLIGFVPFNREKFKQQEEALRQARLMRGSIFVKGKRSTVKSLDSVQYTSMVGPDLPFVIQEGESEFIRRGQFERLYPREDWERYGNLFEVPRYNNILYCRWLEAHSGSSAREYDGLKKDE
ncbi:hypothetical protein CBR_g51027 [Chara braunii]|uniref:Tubulin--tyrosine ligase-like protein 5 n=1 Tax=Chara braunii TaxID=69332 RepID=A0A388M880_CHABU|nr:hypothetical protein CBR_g51027 [Chara braunii]|eukprot:GBG90679.1 hypothetical protein CBR_g51027 [Chara braunii]